MSSIEAVVQSRDLESSLLERRWLLHYFIRDCRNFLRFGRHTFLSGERIWVVPRQVQNEVRISYGRRHTATVRDGSWDLYVRPVESNPVFSEMRQLLHLLDRIQSDSSEPEVLLQVLSSQFQSERSSAARVLSPGLVRLLRLARDVQALGRLRTREELGGFREFFGVYFHIDRNGEALFGRGGQHRFALARLLDLPLIPAQIGIVHDCAVREIGLRELQRMYC